MPINAFFAASVSGSTTTVSITSSGGAGLESHASSRFQLSAQVRLPRPAPWQLPRCTAETQVGGCLLEVNLNIRIQAHPVDSTRLLSRPRRLWLLKVPRQVRESSHLFMIRNPIPAKFITPTGDSPRTTLSTATTTSSSLGAGLLSPCSP